MATASSLDIVAAANDIDLLGRMTAIGASMGISQQDVEAARMRLSSAPVDDAGNTVASVYAYAVATYNPTPRPGQNLAAVTDDMLRHALGTLNGVPA